MTTSFNSSSKLPADPWEQPIGTERKVRKLAAPVKDDWEDDDDDENDVQEGGKTSPPPAPLNSGQPTPVDDEDPRKIWETANAEVAAPMPTLLSSRTGSAIPPPAAAFQPSLRILKRPQSSSPSQSAPTTPSLSGESIQEREARYAAARERIFGTENAGNESGNKNTSDVRVIREPRAPDSASGSQGSVAGFKGRSAKAPSSSRPTATP